MLGEKGSDFYLKDKFLEASLLSEFSSLGSRWKLPGSREHVARRFLEEVRARSVKATLGWVRNMSFFVFDIFGLIRIGIGLDSLINMGVVFWMWS